MCSTMDATQSTPSSVPLVPHDPTMTGMFAARLPVSSARRSCSTASSVVLGVPVPK
jgi:hypothetical protein